MDLSTTYMGLNLKNPLVPGASPMSQTLEGIKQLEDAGAGAIVMYSLFEEQLSLEQRSLDHYLTHGSESFAEALSYFPEPEEYNLGPDAYLDLIRAAKDATDIPIIGSLNGVSPVGWSEYARKIEQAGADALELNVYYLPTDPGLSAEKVEDVYLNILRETKSSVKIPISMKLSPFFSAPVNMAKKLDDEGAAGLVLFNRFYQPEIDIEELEVVPKVVLSEPNEKRLPMRWIAILYSNVHADLIATTGVHSGRDVLQYLMAGANATQLCSSLLLNGPGHLQTILNEVTEWMTEHEYESIQEMIGSMSQKSCPEPAAFERANYMKALTNYHRVV